ncbi:MAG: hypothetical protein N2318_10890 [Meiothermus sp.]|nr:hypothetical protein [Meiothermus sp.]
MTTLRKLAQNQSRYYAADFDRRDDCNAYWPLTAAPDAFMDTPLYLITPMPGMDFHVAQAKEGEFSLVVCSVQEYMARFPGRVNAEGQTVRQAMAEYARGQTGNPFLQWTVEDCERWTAQAEAMGFDPIYAQAEYALLEQEELNRTAPF